MPDLKFLPACGCSACDKPIGEIGSVLSDGAAPLCFDCCLDQLRQTSPLLDQALTAMAHARDHPNPEAVHWASLVDRVGNDPDGISRLAGAERTYFLLSVFNGEVLNGGITQFFTNSSGAYFSETIKCLRQLGANTELRLLTQAKALMFPDTEPSVDHAERMMQQLQWMDSPEQPDEIERLARLEAISQALWDHSDQFSAAVQRFGIQSGFFEPLNDPPHQPTT